MAAPVRFRGDVAGRPDRGRAPHPEAAHPCAATAEIAALLRGPRREAVIVHRGRHAVYVEDHGRQLAVLARDAVAVPCGIQTTWPDLTGVRSVLLGGEACVVDGRELRVRRFVDARVAPVPSTGTAAALPLASLRAEVLASLPGTTTSYEALRDGDPASVAGLLGRGPGLTPLGDDVLAGWLVARYARGDRGGAVADAVLAEAPRRTTTVSAVLLAHAVRGEAVPELRALLACLAADDDSRRDRSLQALRAVGHTSGAGLALGVALAYDLTSPAARAA